MANASGPDISFYQDDPTTPQRVDFAKMKQQADFVIIRAGQNLWPDRDFKYNWGEAKKAGLPRGSYWYYDSRAEPKQQAEKWIETLGDDLGELPLFADIEETYNGPYAGWQRWYDFLERLKALARGKEIAIYTGYYYWTANAPSPITNPANLEYFHQYPLWVANYKVAKPRVPPPWQEDEWLFWQYTEEGDGTLYGVESKEIDLNYFNGDLAAFRKRFNLQEQPAGKYTLDLSVRSGAGASFGVLGQLKQDDVIEKIETSGNWTRIRRESDNLTGWTVNAFLTPVAAPPPPPPPPPGPTPPPSKWYRVNTNVLNLRDGPGTNFNVIGKLNYNEIVEGLLVSADGLWLKLRRSDGVEGWASLDYLVAVSAPPPPVQVTTWYKVNAATLNVREGPDTSFKVLGTLKQGQIVESRETNADGSWARIRRFDGLVGWGLVSYLTSLGTAAPPSLSFTLFNGVTYYRKESAAPRKIVAHIIVLDPKMEGVQFLVTPPSHSSGILCSRKTSQFIKDFGMKIAINGDGFKYLSPSEYDPQTYCPSGGEAVKVFSYAASRGNVYSPKLPDRPVLYINQNNDILFDTPPSSIYNAISGDRYLVRKGSVPTNLENQSVEPRTAIGLSQNGRSLILAVVDGRQPGYSEGVTFPEMGSLMLAHGAYNAINMDGGGSSTLAIQGILGVPFVLNSPIEGGIPGNEAAVANHLGVKVK